MAAGKESTVLKGVGENMGGSAENGDSPREGGKQLAWSKKISEVE